MRKMMKYGKTYGGADPELIEGDVFRIVVKISEYGQSVKAQPETPQVTDPVRRLLRVLENQPLSSKEIREKLRLKHRQNFRENYLHPA